MNERYGAAREHFFAAVRTLATSPQSIQARLIEATDHILEVSIEDFHRDRELKIKFARILDLLAVDKADLRTVAVDTASQMTHFEAGKVADLICDFYFELR